MKKSSRTDISDFIGDIIATGSSPTAVGEAYHIGDSDLPAPSGEKVQPILQEIAERYGSRDPLVAETARHLTTIGRAYQLSERSTGLSQFEVVKSWNCRDRGMGGL